MYTNVKLITKKQKILADSPVTKIAVGLALAFWQLPQCYLLLTFEKLSQLKGNLEIT